MGRKLKVATFVPIVCLGFAVAALAQSNPSGCLAGYVFDVSTDSSVAGVQVYAYGECVGSGCVNAGTAVATTDVDGFWEFDAYHPSSPVDLTPEAGREALTMLVWPSGYAGVVSYHTPDYFVVQGKNVSQVPRIYLTPTGSAVDADGDGISDLLEADIGTSTSTSDLNLDGVLDGYDTDGDGLSDGAEYYGVNHIDLNGLGADPMRADIFVECDYTAGYEPLQASIDEVIEAFANAPIVNPDGSTGVSLHVQIDAEIDDPSADYYDLNPAFNEYQEIRNANFSPDREGVFHYCVWTQKFDATSITGNAFGIGGDGFIVTLNNRIGDQEREAGTFMHELGHNLGLQHGGQNGTHCKPNYFSVMSYIFQQRCMLLSTGAPPVFDYSRAATVAIDESSVDEAAGVSPVFPSETSEISRHRPFRTTSADCSFNSRPSGYFLSGSALSNIDWNIDGTIETIVRDFDHDTILTDSYSAWDDWENLNIPGNGAIAARASVSGGLLSASLGQDSAVELSGRRTRAGQSIAVQDAAEALERKHLEQRAYTLRRRAERVDRVFEEDPEAVCSSLPEEDQFATFTSREEALRVLGSREDNDEN